MAFNGVLCKKAADQTAANYSTSTAVAWDGTDVYDTHAAHDPSSSNTKIIIPADWDQKYGVITAQIYATSCTSGSSVWLYIGKNGAAMFFGGAAETHLTGAGDGTTNGYVSVQTAPFLLETGDEYEVYFYCSDTSITIESDSSTFGLRVIPQTKIGSGVLCKLSGDQAAANYSTPTAVAWDGTDIYDTDGAHDPSSSNTKIIIPSAWNGKYGIFTGSVVATSVGSGASLSIKVQKGASDAYDGFGGRCVNVGNLTTAYLNCFTQPIVLATAEEYTLVLYCSDTSILFESDASSFGCFIYD